MDKSLKYWYDFKREPIFKSGFLIGMKANQQNGAGTGFSTKEMRDDV